MESLKEVLRRSLDDEREAVLWKLEGLSERDARRPITTTGSNVLGIVKHLANEELDYISLTFNRPTGLDRPEPDDTGPPSFDMWASKTESIEGIVELYKAAARLTTEAINDLDLDAPGRVPWWENGDTTFGEVLVHLLKETARHAGHVDILRESIDGVIGLSLGSPNLPDGVDEEYWEKYVDYLRTIAESF